MRKLGFDSNHSKLIKAGIEKVTDAVSGRGLMRLDTPAPGPGPATCCVRLRPRRSLTSGAPTLVTEPPTRRVVTGHHMCSQ